MAGEGQLARDVRVGLGGDFAQPLQEKKTMQAAETHFLDELWHRKPIRIHVREFACVFSIIFLGIGGYTVWSSGSLVTLGWLSVLTAIFLVLGYKAPAVLHPLWKAWMGFAHYLGIVMTFLIMGLCWLLLLIPISLLLRVIGKKVMDLSFDRSVESYWEERPSKLHNFELLERQF